MRLLLIVADGVSEALSLTLTAMLIHVPKMLKTAPRCQPGTAETEDDHQEEDSAPHTELTDPQAISSGGRDRLRQTTQGEHYDRDQSRSQHDHRDE